MDLISIEQFKAALPTTMRKAINTELVDSINNTLSSSDELLNLRENLLSYSSVLQDGKYKIQDYINAVKYVSYKLLGNSNLSAYVKTFPDRYQILVSKGSTSKDISCYVAAYNKNKLVNLIFEQTLIPSHILNADLYQKALNTQADLMMTARSEKVRCDAANSILTQLKQPEIKKMELNISKTEDNSISELKRTTLELVVQQRKMIEANAMSASEVAKSKIIEGEYKEVGE